jgi:aminoglycoside phosphotransferase (APT) family kinase protein
MSYSILLEKYKNVNLVKINGGYTNNVFFLENYFPKIIVKIYNKKQYNNDAGKNELSALRLLNESNVSPKLHDFLEDDSNLYIIMDYIIGINGQNILENNEIDNIKKLYELLGYNLLKNIHSIKQEKNVMKLPEVKLEDINNGIFEYLDNNTKETIKNMLDIKVNENNTLIHGDFGPHNVIYHNNSIIAIDWEWAGYGNPMYDITWVLWFTNIHYPNYYQILSDIFINTYLKHNRINISETLIKAYSISNVLKILNRIKKKNIESKNEWVRRLNWTIENDLLII